MSASPTPFFAPGSFWNSPIPEGATLSSRSQEWMNLIANSTPAAGLHINLDNWTIPVFEADSATPMTPVYGKLLRCPLSQGHILASERKLRSGDHPLGIHPSVTQGVPIPPEARPDARHDAHMVVLQSETGRAYDFWQIRREEDGHWYTNSAISYDLQGSGVFDAETVGAISNDESVHLYGPCRASGVPLLAGLVMEREARAGEICHKLAFACPVPGLQERVFPPAAWTDGWLPGGVPEGAVLQLDPQLDLAQFDLTPAAYAVARALQEFGAVLVDYAGAPTLYGELLKPHPGRTWEGALGEHDLEVIPFSHYHILETGPLQSGGSHPVYHQGMSRLFYEHLENQGENAIPKRPGLKPPLSQRQKGFTLMELLVVIGIIAVLAALLFPIVGSMTKRSDAASCASNLRQLGLHFQRYLQEEGSGYLPIAWASQTHKDNFGLPYTGGFCDYFHGSSGVDFKQVFGCPTQRKNKQKLWGTTGTPLKQRRTYGYNEYVTREGSVSQPTPAIRYTEPHLTMIFGDGDNSDGGGNAAYYNSNLNPSRAPEQVHNGFANVLFLDNHVEAISREEIPTGAEAQVTESNDRVFWFGNRN